MIGAFVLNGEERCLSFFRQGDRAFLGSLGCFCNLAGLEHAGRDPGILDRTVGINDLDALKVGLDHAKGLADDLRTGTALTACHTASFIKAA